MVKTFPENTYTRDDIYEMSQDAELEVVDTKIDNHIYILEVVLQARGEEDVTLFEFRSSDDETYDKVSDNWPDVAKTPIYDTHCTCLMTGFHRISMHGTSPEWDENYFWVRPN